MDLFALCNLIETATCFKNVQNKSLVDVLLTNAPRNFTNTGTISNGLSDVHHIIYGVFSHCNFRYRARSITYRSYKSFDQDKFNKDLANAPFHVGSVFNCVEDKYWFFHHLLLSILNEHAPLKTKKIRPVQPPFMNARLRKNVHLKSQLRNRYNKFPTRRNWEMFRIQRNRTSHIRKVSIRNYFIEHCSGKQDKSFYKTVKPFISKKPPAASPAHLIEGNKLVNDETEIANIMNDYYVNIAKDIGAYDSDLEDLTDSVFVEKSVEKFKNHPSILRIKKTVKNVSCFSFNAVSCDHIVKNLSKLNVKKGAGYDRITPKVMKIAANTLSCSYKSC